MHRFATMLAALATALMLSACGSPGSDAPEDIKQALAAVKSTTAPHQLTRSAFYVAFPEGKPSDYVSYVFSTMGSAEMPYAFDEYEAEQMRSIGQVVYPDSVTLVPHQRDPNAARQLVLTADDARGVLIARGYVRGTEEPVLEKEWELKKVTPAPGVREMYEGNVQMGMDPY